MSSTKNRLEIVEKQFVCQILNAELDVQRDPLLLPQIGADREVENGPGTDTASLEIDLIVESGVETLCHKIAERGARLYIRRHARVVPTAESCIEAGAPMVVAQLKLRLIALVVIVGEFDVRYLETLSILTQEKAAVDWRNAISAGIRIRYESMKTSDVS